MQHSNAAQCCVQSQEAQQHPAVAQTRLHGRSRTADLEQCTYLEPALCSCHRARQCACAKRGHAQGCTRCRCGRSVSKHIQHTGMSCTHQPHDSHGRPAGAGLHACAPKWNANVGLASRSRVTAKIGAASWSGRPLMTCHCQHAQRCGRAEGATETRHCADRGVLPTLRPGMHAHETGLLGGQQGDSGGSA